MTKRTQLLTTIRCNPNPVSMSNSAPQYFLIGEVFYLRKKLFRKEPIRKVVFKCERFAEKHQIESVKTEIKRNLNEFMSRYYNSK